MDAFDLSRSDFMASALAAAAVSGDATAVRVTAPPAAASFHFDRDAFAAMINRPYPHRQLAMPATYGEATAAMSEFRRAIANYADPNGMAAGPNSLHCAAVLYRGLSSFMVLTDAMWAKYPIGLLCDEELRPNDVQLRATWTAMRRNPMTGYLRELIEHGVSFFVCNNHLNELSGVIAERAGLDDAPASPEHVRSIHDDLAAHFIPSTMVVPVGVAAIIALQEARFTYLP